ncbi:helix-turn-helix domain-containing protein [Sporomusa silvacetica]|uniref:helix-turn-helix domain-containing protein n=1 Tax=Sporomusa silvacetica TaxID=55504 RepID=UPI000B99E019
MFKEKNGNLSKVAKRMGICRQTLYNKINNSENLKGKLYKIDGKLLRKSKKK